MGLYTMNYHENQKRREKVIDLMRKDDWKGVVEEFKVSGDWIMIADIYTREWMTIVTPS